MAIKETKGTILKYDESGIMTAVGKVDSLTPPSRTVNTQRAKGLEDEVSSVHATGSADGGQCSFSLYLDFASAPHAALFELVHDHANAVATPDLLTKDWDIDFTQYATTRTWTFDGVLTQFNVDSIGVDALLKASGTIEVGDTSVLPTA